MNTLTLLSLPPLLAAATFQLTILASTLSSERAGDLPAMSLATSGSRAGLTDRQFLAALDAAGRQASQFMKEDRGFLTKLDEVALLAIPRATFVAPPRPAPQNVAFHTTSEQPIFADGDSVIPRATFVAPPRAALSTPAERSTSARAVEQAASADREASAAAGQKTASRRTSMFTYDGRVFATRATELIGMNDRLPMGMLSR